MLGCFLAVFLVVAITTLFTPRQYLGRVQIEFLGPEAHASAMGEATTLDEDARNRFTQTQFEAIQARKNLEHVVAKLGLMDMWGLEDENAATEKLSGKIKMRQLEGTDMVAIDVYDKNAQLAADIANAVALSFRERKMQSSKALQREAEVAVEKHLQVQEAKVDKARADLDRIAGEKNNTATALNNSLVAPDDDSSTTAALAEAEKEVQALKARAAEFKKLELEDFLQRASALNMADSTLKELLPKYFNLRLTLRSLSDSGLGPKHPKMVSIQNQISETQALLSSIADNIQKNLQTELQIAEEHRDRIAQAHQDRLDRTSNVAFTEAQTNFRQQLEILEQMRASFTIDQATTTTPPVLEIHEEAVAAKHPAQPRVLLNLGLGALFGLGLALGVTFFLEYLDTSIKTVDEAERHLQLPVLAVIPSGVGVLHKETEECPDSEAYRILRTNLDFNRPGPEANAITVVSGCAGEGKSTTLVNLAYVCAQSGLNTLIIDADLRRPRMHHLFNLENQMGLTDYLNREATLQEVVTQTVFDHLYLLPSGALPPDTSGLLSSAAMVELLADVKSRFDLVLVDAPPILGVSDGSVLVNEVDMTMIVMQHRRMPRNMVLNVKHAVENAGGRLLGVVMNNVDIRSHSQYSYYTNYYTYFSPERKAAKAKAQRQQHLAEADPSVS